MSDENFMGFSMKDAVQFALDEGEVTPEVLTSTGAGKALLEIYQKEDPQWLEKAKLIGRLPGFPVPTKCAAIVMGALPILTQVLVIYSVEDEELTMSQALNALATLSRAVGVPQKVYVEYITGLILQGVIQANTAADPMAVFEDASPGVMHRVIANVTAPWFIAMVNELGAMQPVLESIGIVFTEDNSLLGVTEEEEGT